MHASAHYAMGQSHTICQDYAVAGSCARGSFGIVADGCSSSPHTDTGSRLLALSVLGAWRDSDGCFEEALDRGLTEAAVGAARLGLPGSCLDSTLLIASASRGAARAAVFGDGAVAALRRDGTAELHCVSYGGNAPAYPSYRMDPERLEAWGLGFGRWKLQSHCGTAPSSAEEGEGHSPHLFSFDASAYSLVAIMSDGICSFGAPCPDGGRMEVNPTEVAARLLAVKTFTGDFALRRLRSFLRRGCPAMGWTWSDDVSIAAIHLGERGSQ
jgi:hypothetical protein